jgi:hypothetical protein
MYMNIFHARVAGTADSSDSGLDCASTFIRKQITRNAIVSDIGCGITDPRSLDPERCRCLAPATSTENYATLVRANNVSMDDLSHDTRRIAKCG